MFIAITDKIQDNRQYINIYQNSKNFKTHKSKQPTYTISVPQEKTDEILQTLDKLETFSPKVNKTYKENPKEIQKGIITGSAVLAGAFAYTTVSLLSSVSILGKKSKGIIRAITTGVAIVAGGFVGNKIFHKSASIFKKLDELGMRIESSKEKTIQENQTKTEPDKETKEI